MAVQIKVEKIISPQERQVVGLMKKLEMSLEATLRSPAVKGRLKSEMDKVTANWYTKPQMAGRYSNPDQDTQQMYVFPRAGGPTTQEGLTGRDVWTILSLGAKAHDISARNAPTLRIRAGYIPKTMPGGFWGGPGVFIGDVYRKKAVSHPGVEARNFEEEIVKKVGQSIEKVIIQAIEAALT